MKKKKVRDTFMKNFKVVVACNGFKLCADKSEVSGKIIVDVVLGCNAVPFCHHYVQGVLWCLDDTAIPATRR